MKYSWMIIFCCFLLGCDEAKQLQEDKEKATIRVSFYLSTVLHDDHLFIIGRYGNFMHHMDCPCMKKQTEEKPPSPVIISSPNILDLLKK